MQNMKLAESTNSKFEILIKTCAIMSKSEIQRYQFFTCHIPSWRKLSNLCNGKGGGESMKKRVYLYFP